MLYITNKWINIMHLSLSSLYIIYTTKQTKIIICNCCKDYVQLLWMYIMCLQHNWVVWGHLVAVLAATCNCLINWQWNTGCYGCCTQAWAVIADELPSVCLYLLTYSSPWPKWPYAYSTLHFHFVHLTNLLDLSP